MKKPKCTNNFNYAIKESYLLQADDSRLRRILDANYEKANLNELVQECTHWQAVRNRIKSRRYPISLAPICATKMLQKNTT